jgi:hypothetical protein
MQKRKGYCFWRNNTTPIYDTTRKAFRAMPLYALKGRPDIEIIKDGNYIGIEAKSGSGRLSVHQKEFRDMVKQNGGEYYEVRSIDDLKEIGL